MIPPKHLQQFSRKSFTENEITYKSSNQRLLLKKSLLKDKRGNTVWLCLKQSILPDGTYQNDREIPFHSLTEALGNCTKQEPECMDDEEYGTAKRRYEMRL